ncbi:unnamed protein product [Phytophthora fragariaefolia]|uniref:Unnamed protein product n=1 Tax=Phytophthora fragariaefolia TaxID=1490495 RepID=A0A9W7CYQ4_9STRA|nr:unnamed protein product [Phytophthora fragariaefolia]
MDRVAEFTQLGADPNRVPLPKTPETKRPTKGERFRSTVPPTYFEDSHMLTPKEGKPRGGRYDHLYDASGKAELGDSRDDSADPRRDRDETVKGQIRRLGYDEAERDNSQYLELRTHFSLDKVAEFEGKRYRSDASLQWLKRFIYEMKGIRMPQNSWCEPFSLSLGRAAKSWYRQLPKKTQQRWSLLSEAFLDYYYSQFDQSAPTRYYSARRKENEPICDFLIRLNGYSHTAKIQYEKGGADAADHVEQFLLNCEDDGIMDLLYLLQLADIQRVEQIINKKILSEKRKKQRDRLSAEPAVEANHVFAFVGKAHRPEMWCVRNDGLECEYDGQNELGDPEEDRRAVASMATGTRRVAERHSKMMKLSPGERMGWWSAQKLDRRVRMRALVLGAVNDVRTKILLDTGANVSAVRESFAWRLHLKRRTNSDRQIDVQVVYEFEMWIMPPNAGVDLILGTDFMTPAGIRLDLYNLTARVPDEVEIRLIRSRSAWLTEPTYGDRVSNGPAESLSIPARMIAEFTLRRKQPSEDTHEFWVRRAKDWIPTVAHSSRCKPTRVLLTNVSGKPMWCPAHFPVILWAPHGELPPDDGYVRLNSAKYRDWQVLAYEAAMDKALLKREQQLYADWLTRQPPAVKRRQYAVPKDVMKRTAAASAEPASDRTEATVRSIESARDVLHKSETTESTADDSVHYEPAKSAGDGPASSVQAVATSCELTDCDIVESAVAAQTDAAEWNEGPNAGEAHQSRLGMTILEAKSPAQASEREHLSRVDSVRHETAELKETLRSARELSAELSADSKEKCPVREAIDSLLSDEIEVSDAALADDPEEDLRLRFVAAMAMCKEESITVVDKSATNPVEFKCSANEIDLEDYAHELAFLPDLTDSASTVLWLECGMLDSYAESAGEAGEGAESARRHHDCQRKCTSTTSLWSNMRHRCART